MILLDRLLWDFYSRSALEAPGGFFVGRSSGSGCGRLGLFDLPQSGEYVLRVYDVNGYTGQYGLRVELPESTSSILTLDQVESGNIEVGGEAFLFFDIEQDNTRVFFDSQSCDALGQSQLFNPDGQIVQARSCRNDYPMTLDAGTWVWRLYSDTNRRNDYQVRVWTVPEPTTSTYTLNDVQFGSLRTPTDSHAYTFEVAADGTEVFIDVQQCHATGRIQLISPTGAAAVDANCIDRTVVLNAGTWTFIIESENALFGNYRFRLWPIGERQSFDYNLDQLQSGSLSFPTDSHSYSFDIAADGTEVFIDIQQCHTTGRFRLVDPSGSTAVNALCTDRSVVLDAGTWTLVMESTNSFFGLYRFRLWEVPDRQDFTYTIGDVAAGALTFPTDSHRYSFDVPTSGVVYQVDIQQCHSTGRWQLIGPLGNVGYSSSVCSDKTVTLNAGTWQMRMYSTNGSFGPYQFQVREQ